MMKLSRKMMVPVLAVLAAGALTAAGAVPAGASSNPNGRPRVLHSSGATARVRPGTTLCVTNLYFDAFGNLAHPMTVRQSPPAVWGLRAKAGAATQYVTFRSGLRDLNTGKVSYGRFAPWAVATSRRPATWSGTTTWKNGNPFVDVRHKYLGQVDVLWWAGGKYLGEVVLQPVYDHNVAFYGGSTIHDTWGKTCHNYQN